MNFPPFHAFFRPFLELLQRRGELHMSAVQAELQALSGLTQEQLALRLPSGKVTVVCNRIGWARTYLFKAGLIERSGRARYRLTALGGRLLAEHAGPIGLRHLRALPSFAEWTARGAEEREGNAGDEESSGGISGDESPQEAMLRHESTLRGLVEEELLERMRAMAPERFEWLVEQLVVKLGYGSSGDDVRRALGGGAGDGGVDGVIHEDRLGLGQIYLQAKRWQEDHTVGRPLIQAFVGAMHGRAQRGVFLTTADFSREARDYAQSLHGLRLRLVSGRELAALMIECGLGVSDERTYRTYRIDSDFFDEAE